jgi:hypothetical protein
MIFHIRKQLKPARGNMWYRDKSDRCRGTICGAPVDEYNQSWSDRLRVRPWVHPDHGQMTPCPVCVAIVKNDPKNAGRYIPR